MTARSLIEQLLFMLFHPQLFPLLIAMLKTSSSHSFWIISSQVNRWTFFGIHTRQIVSKIRPETKIPRNWNTFLQDNTNKKELFALLISRVSNFQFPGNKEVNITSDESVVTSRGSSDMQRCDHKEADTRIAVHVQHVLDKGCKQAFFLNSGYGCSRHINRAFPQHDRLISICR